MNEVDDLVIELLANSEAVLRERVASLEADVAAYRLLAQQAIHALHDLTVNYDRHVARSRVLLEQCRELRAQLRHQVAA